MHTYLFEVDGEKIDMGLIIVALPLGGLGGFRLPINKEQQYLYVFR